MRITIDFDPVDNIWWASLFSETGEYIMSMPTAEAILYWGLAL